jgi:sulfide dehydrogenase cytochrome subunit
MASMRAFRDGSRPATVMHQLAKGFSDDQVKLIADFYAGQKKAAP